MVAGFERIEGELARIMRTLEPELDGTGISAANLVWGFLMRTSARNALRGRVDAIREDAISAEVALKVADETTLYAVVTRESVRELGLFPGREAVALIKAPFVLIARADDARAPPRATRSAGPWSGASRAGSTPSSRSTSAAARR